MNKTTATIDQLHEFDTLIDARSPAEFADDRIPGALNCPSLNDEQRAIVGTIYKQKSAFEARRLGGAMVAENIAHHLYTHFQDKPKNWRPLVYCWRGGQRSGAFVSWLRMVGWDARQLEGGYKRWRRHVLDEMTHLPQQFEMRVISGPTGSAKTRVLEELAAAGAQVLDLEDLAAHKGSVLGALPDREQPPQKWFETQVYQTLSGFDRERTVFIEAESRKIGRLHVPDALIHHMRDSACITIEASHAARIDFLVRDYAYLGDDVPRLQGRLACLHGLQSNETLERWKALAAEHRLRELFTELVDKHYDPLYQRSQNHNYIGFADARLYATDDLSPQGIARLAQEIAASETTACVN